jgi:SUMO ligase MMS21 Smc5/6 complex component
VSYAEGNFLEAMVFLVDALTFLDRCHMFKDNALFVSSTRRKMVSVLQALGRLDEACRYDPPPNLVSVQCPNAQPYKAWTNEKIFHRPTHGAPPVLIDLDADMSRPTFVGLVRNPHVNEAQKKMEHDHVLKCLSNVATNEEAQKKIDAVTALFAKQMEADKVFEELWQEEEAKEEAKVGAKEGRISKRKARRLQKAKREAAAPEPPPPEDPEQRYRAALESLDVSLQCPLTLATMQDPVLTQSGHTFERKEIELWFETKNTCPMTGVAVTSKKLTPNIALKAVIEALHVLKEATEARERAASILAAPKSM